MAAINPITVSLPADLPENWTAGQTVSPGGEEAGLTMQHGYNYLMQQVNAAQTALQQIAAYFPNLKTVTDGGGFVVMAENIPTADRQPDTLYASIARDYSGPIPTFGGDGNG